MPIILKDGARVQLATQQALVWMLSEPTDPGGIAEAPASQGAVGHAELCPMDRFMLMASAFYPPVTGGKNATSSPSLIRVSGRAIS